MPDNTNTPPFGVPCYAPCVDLARQQERLTSIQAAVAALERRADDLHAKISSSNVRIDGSEKRLVALVGEDGKNGRVSAMQRTLNETEKLAEQNARDIAKLRWTQIKWSAGGAMGGGGAMAAIIELAKHFIH